jgi:hypothetical protein
MSYKTLHTEIESAVNNLPFNVVFGHGRLSDFFTIEADKVLNQGINNPIIWMEPATSQSTILTGTIKSTRTYSVNIDVMVQDQADSLPNEMRAITELTDEICNQLVYSFNDSDTISILAASWVPFYRDQMLIVTGHRITMTVEILKSDPC